jgi:predicted GH43/DUF377 family glycosyl hydrolase
MAVDPTTATRELVQRMPIKVESDQRRVITLPFAPWTGPRVHDALERIRRMPQSEVRKLLASVFASFSGRHEDLTAVLLENFAVVNSYVDTRRKISEERRLLMGSYFTMEFSQESCALFNPSIVLHPNQEGVPEGSMRFVMSLRATGEGHVSSIVFRQGVITARHEVELDPAPRFSSRARLAPDHHYDKPLFHRKLGEMSVDSSIVDAIMSTLPDSFTLEELEEALTNKRSSSRGLARFVETSESMRWLARSNYRLRLASNADVSSIVIFPQSENESRGVEDLRLVRFVDDDGTVRYFGTYTAFNGYRILPMLLETENFQSISIHTLNGACAQNKGMGLFPRRINGHYAMCSRIDGQNLYIMYSDILHFWESAELLARPRYPWELMILGNCGSPIETSEGWLLLTHGVGPMRRYCIGAMLLDLENPCQVIGRLREPLIEPQEHERDGYVPNVVYSCGGMIYGEFLYLPYATADRSTVVARIDLDGLLHQLKQSPPE